MSRFKIIVFLFAMGILGVIMAAAYWFYARVIAPDANLQTEITAMGGKKGTPPDPGLKRFDKALDLVRASDLDNGRTALYDLVRTFPESTRVTEAKRIIGEMNMDMLFSADINPLKKDYIVQPGDSLGLIARKNQTTVECIMRANGLQSGMLQPGDHLFVFPLDFEIVVDISARTLTLLRNTRFFREYPALDVKVPTTVKIPSDPKGSYQSKIGDKAAWVRGNRVSPGSADFMNADKWLVESKGFNIRALPKARPIAPKGVTVAASKGKSGKARGAVLEGTTVDDDNVDATAGVPATGVFLPREDIEELFTIIRTQTPLKVVR